MNYNQQRSEEIISFVFWREGKVVRTKKKKKKNLLFVQPKQ